MTSDSTTIRQVTGDELLTAARPLQALAFGSTPQPDSGIEEARAALVYSEANTSLVAFDDGEPRAVVVGIPMRENVRGSILPMLGVSGVATHPMARRKGHVRALLTTLHGQLRDSGHVVSTLYPFRPSFYEKFGYVGFPKARRIRLLPEGLRRGTRTEVSGELEFHQIGAVFDTWYAYIETLMAERHGFAVHPYSGMKRLGDRNDQWAVFARHDGEVVGTLVYRTDGFGEQVDVGKFLYRGPIGRTLLLQWLARHVDQYASFGMELPPEERPDLWYTDLQYVDETKVQMPMHSAPAGRVLSVEGLTGIAVGEARATVEVVDDPFVEGTWTLDGYGGALDVLKGGTPTATLTVHGLSGLVYGVLDPAELELRGYGTVDPKTVEALRTLFPPVSPYLFSGF